MYDIPLDTTETTARWQDYRDHRGNGEHTVVGTVKVLEGLWSPQLANRRDIVVYLPPSYHETTKRYPVLYMHDGQNLFDEATSYAGEWGVDETMEALSAEGIEAIVVGIPNAGPLRFSEYSPFVGAYAGTGQGEPYLQFVVETVKPLVDRDFRTLPDRRHTGIMGSSMGGLVSLYAFFRYRETFGSVGAMSPSLWFGRGAFFQYVRRAPFVPGRIYLDVGTREGSERFRADVRQMHVALEQKGYRAGRDLLYVEEVGASHHEAAWRRRLPQALRFLLAGDGAPLEQKRTEIGPAHV